MTSAAAVPLPCWPGLLADICGVDRSVAVAALEEAVARGVVIGRPGGQYAFLHDLLPQALLTGLTAEERTGLHERVAAMIAYDNALLFSRVEQLATIDELTGVFNRRQFFELAGRQVALAGR